ncbi:hypothetical protein [Staphylococcus aureus]|uniref:hypothetical protein n=1 Tax=Staphylococcus aureus TaxID=1280 RepID=UPI001BFDCB61|nr:hypothetical protein [Staphylococcus aureus]
MQNLEGRKKQYKDKWIHVKLDSEIIGKSYNEEFYFYTTLHNEMDNDKPNVGHLIFKYEGNDQWKITDFEIAKQYRGQSYGAAMFIEALSVIERLNTSREVYVHGEISGAYIENRYNYKNVKLSTGYKKLKKFYKDLGFNLDADTRFYKSLPVELISDWQSIIKYTMEVKDLKLELAFKDIIIESHEKTRSLLEDSLLGRYILKRIESRRI